MKNRRRLKITQPEFQFIMGDDWQFFLDKIVKSCHCPNCGDDNYQSMIVDYAIMVEANNDIFLNGSCAKCKSPISRYLETSEVPDKMERIYKIKKSCR